MKQIKYFLILILSFSSILFAQERMILRTNGEQIKLNYKKDLREAIKETKIKGRDGVIARNHFVYQTSETAGKFDTLSYRYIVGSPNTNFGFFSQDLMLMWFEAPADMTIEGIGFSCSDDSGYLEDGATVGLRLVKLNWTKEQLQNIVSATPQGYYPSVEDGFNNIDAFGEMATGNWISNDVNNLFPPWTNHENPDSNSFDYDLWSDDGDFLPVVPVASESSNPVYNWLDLTTTEFGDVQVVNGEVFAVVAKNNGVNLDSSRIGFWSDNTLGYPGWKFYVNGRLSSDEPGWWVRMYTWDFAVAVDFSSCYPPRFYIPNPVMTTLSTEPQSVCAEIEYDIECHGAGDSVNFELVYILDDTDTTKIPMSSADNYNYCADIPGQSPSTNIRYWVQFTNRLGRIYTSPRKYEYFIFDPSSPSLLFFNGFEEAEGYPQSYYFGTGDAILEWNYDTWAYGPLTTELVNNYETIIEICTTGRSNYNNDVIREWLRYSPWNNYLLAGQEWLGISHGFIDQDYAEGSFEYDILGITHSYNDVSYDGTSGQELPSRIVPQIGTLLGDPMFQLAEEINARDTATIDSILYDPMKELAVNNWLDGFEVKADDPLIEVFMKAETRGIAGSPEIREVNIGLSRTLNSGNRIVFMSYDPLSVNSTPTYYWFGFSETAPQVQTLNWFDFKPCVDEENDLPSWFSLSQNYPNPFNPSTTIKYSIPNVGNENFRSVQLRIYDILGREVTTLVNKEQKPGKYEIQFDASKLSSGVYYYRLISGSYNQTKKMLIIK